MALLLPLSLLSFLPLLEVFLGLWRSLAPADTIASRPMMRQQEVTRQAGAKSVAIAPGGTEAPRIPGVALVTKATAWRTQRSLAAPAATATLHLERMCMWGPGWYWAWSHQYKRGSEHWNGHAVPHAPSSPKYSETEGDTNFKLEADHEPMAEPMRQAPMRF